MGGQYEVKDGATKKYYSIAGMTVAMQDASGLQYLLTDHLGSTVAVTDSTGTLTSQQRYLPFGGVRSIPNSPILSTDFGYTGQRLLDSGMGGIMDYKARFYSPALGRFQQPDTVIPGTENPQAWNRYSYTYNNPIRYNDSDGHCPICATAVIGAAIGAAVGAVAYTMNNQGESFDAGEFWTTVAVGALAGGLIGSGIGILAAPTVSVATASTVPYLLSSGAAITTSGGSYIASNKGNFETKDFVIKTSVAGTAAAITANPAMRLSGRWATNLLAGEIDYLLTEDKHSLTGHASVILSSTLNTGIQEGIKVGLEDYLLIDRPISNVGKGPIPSGYKNTVVSNIFKNATFDVFDGVLTGAITPTAKKIESLLRMK